MKISTTCCDLRLYDGTIPFRGINLSLIYAFEISNPSNWLMVPEKMLLSLLYVMPYT